VIGTDAVYPGIDVVGIDVKAAIQFGTGLVDAFGLRGEAAVPLGLDLDRFYKGGGPDYRLNLGHGTAVL